MLKILILLSVMLAAYAKDDIEVMNDIRLSDYKDFSKKWKFVTVRYRKDTGEMRFTYANDLAWKSLQNKVRKYPDGAVFAKIGIQTQKDLDFRSSIVPSGARRIQFMVRDEKKYAPTKGWGYALFSPDGKRFKGNPKAESLACAACHQLVRDKGQVFSTPLNLISFEPEQRIENDSWDNRIVFVEMKTMKLPENVRKFVPENFKKIKTVDGELTKHVFFGTLDEIRPTLVEHSAGSGLPSALVSSDGKQFSLVVPAIIKKCGKKKGFRGYHTVPAGKKKVFEIEVCEE